MILDKNVYILSMQETNVQINLDHELISVPCYKYETETNTVRPGWEHLLVQNLITSDIMTLKESEIM